jgi:hypothetical protein
MQLAVNLKYERMKRKPAYFVLSPKFSEMLVFESLNVNQKASKFL